MPSRCTTPFHGRTRAVAGWAPRPPAHASGPVSEDAIRAGIREAARDMLGDVTRAELEAHDLEGRRRKVRAVVERVTVGPAGPSAVLAPASTLQISP